MEDTDKLIEIASKPLKNPIEKKSLNKLSSVFEFITELKIKSHEEVEVLCKVVYYRYTQWCKSMNIKHKSYVHFVADFKKKFNSKTKTTGSVFYINPKDWLDMSESYKQEASEFYERSKKKNKEKR